MESSFPSIIISLSLLESGDFQARIDMIGAACESAEKVISDARKYYGLGTRQGPTLIPTSAVC